MKTVYKIWGEDYELSEDPIVYETYEGAVEGLSKWEDFLGMSAKDALDLGEVQVEEWTLK